ncbi:MAG: efflux RND transporter periplasmic adaptor subunit [Bacteroidales bacterium]
MKIIYPGLFSLIILTAGCSNNQPKAVIAGPTLVKVIEVSPESVSIPVRSSGILLSSEELKLSFKTGGIVSRIPVREGDRVKKGQSIAFLNLSEINAQVSLAVNGYEKALRDLNRVKNLYADSVATLEQLQNATTAVSMASSNLEIAHFNLAHSTIVAPDNGIILRQLVRENELVSQGYPVFLFGTSGKNWKVKTGISDRDVVKINSGDSAIVTFDAWPGIKFPAVVDQVGEMANSATGTYDTELLVKDNGYRFATGFVASAEIFPSGKGSYLLIPVGSIIEADGETGYVFTVSDSGTVSKVRITIVTISGNKAAVTDSPAGIREIVSEGAAYLRDGEKVKVVK